MQPLPIDSACPEQDDFAAFLRGRLASPSAAALEVHVARCAACRRRLAMLARSASTVSHASIDSVSPTFAQGSRADETGLAAGARIGRYAVLDRRGAGGMGVVYSAHDPELCRNVALKVLHNDAASSTDRPVHDQLLREARAMAQLAHSNVVTVFEVGRAGDHAFIAMELIEGQTLTRWLNARHRGQREILAAFLAAGNGLAAAHDAGLVHRDFKPDNVLVRDDGRICVTDFGLARAACPPVEPAPGNAAEPARGLAVARTGLAGTLAYMAPEQYFARRADPRADQFAFAVALYEALYRERPFAHPRFTEEGQPATVRIRSAPPGSWVSLALREVLLRALSAAPEDRYPSMHELLDALAATMRPRGGRRIAIAAILVAAVAVGSAATYAIHLRRAAEERAELVGQLRSLIPELRTRLRTAHMLPLHDIRSARDAIRATLRDVERKLQTPAGQREAALGNFVLGQGFRALGDHERALGLLESAWAAGERGPELDAALGYTLGAVYHDRLDRLEQTVQPPLRDAQIREIEARYRDPAMAHLRAALAAGTGSQAYLEALIAFHGHRFAEASQHANAAFAETPTFYEAGALEARAHSAIGRELLSTDQRDAAIAEFAAARRIFERALEIARSDDEAWLGYGEMLYAQANALNRGGAMPADLQQGALAALGNVERINPDNATAYLREAQIHLGQGNIEIVWSRDPGASVDKALAAANQARARGANPAEVDVHVCVAHWEAASYRVRRGIDPGPALDRAITACGNAVAIAPDADKYATLGVVQLTKAFHDAEHGGDPTPSFALAERNLRTALAITDDTGFHYALARLSTGLAHYQVNHGRSPERAVDSAFAEFEATARMDATRADAWAGMSDVLAVRAQRQIQDRDDARATLAHAHRALDRALSIDADYVPAIRHRLWLAELDARALLARHADPGEAVAQMRADARLLSLRFPGDGPAYRMSCRAELLAARWALAQHDGVDGALARATAEAENARAANPADVLAWTTSAEVESLRAEAARAAGRVPDPAMIAHGIAFLERARAIDPGLVEIQQVRDELARQERPGVIEARPPGAPATRSRTGSGPLR